VREPVDVPLELPGQPRLADPGDTEDGDELGLALLRRSVEDLLDEAKLSASADERRLQAGGAERAARSGDDPLRLPEWHRLGLSLELVRARVGVRDRSLGGAPRRLADEHGPRVRQRLDA
jgi:hypothetical protein